MQPFDIEHEAKAMVNEIFYRNGPSPEAIQPAEAFLVAEVIERGLRLAFQAGRSQSQ